MKNLNRRVGRLEAGIAATRIDGHRELLARAAEKLSNEDLATLLESFDCLGPGVKKEIEAGQSEAWRDWQFALGQAAEELRCAA